jgi:hypothetical protein
VKVRNKQTGEREPLRAAGAAERLGEVPNNLMLTGIERWKKVKAQLEEEGDKRKPIMFVLCNDKQLRRARSPTT